MTGQLFSRAHLRVDVIAGLTAAAVILPKALAYATVARLPVAVGLYTSFIPLVAYALLGSSRVLSVTSTATLAILTATELEAVVPGGEPDRLVAAAAMLAVLTGVFLMVASVAKLGFVANFISTPVLVGFKAGIGCVILLDQAPKLLGFHLAKQGFFHDLLQLFSRLPSTSLTTLALGLGTLLAVLLLKHFAPKLPAPLFAVAGGIGISCFLQLEAVGVEVVGAIPSGLPMMVLPDLRLAVALVPGALGIALMSFAESIAAARTFSVAGDPPLRPNRELWATGVANLAGGMLGAMPAGGGTSQTAVIRAAGGSTQQASLVVALVSVGTMLFLGPVLGRMPQATLAAVVVVYSVSLVQPAEFAAIRRVRTMEFVWALVALFGVLAFGTLNGIVVAIIVSLVALLRQEAGAKVHVIGKKRGEDFLRPLSPDHPDDETFGELLILRPEGRLFFANAEHVGEQISALIAEHQPKVVALDLSRVIDVEYSALQTLIEGERRQREAGVSFWLVGLNQSALESVRAVGLAQRLGRDRLLVNARKAIQKFQQGGEGSEPSSLRAEPNSKQGAPTR